MSSIEIGNAEQKKMSPIMMRSLEHVEREEA